MLRELRDAIFNKAPFFDGNGRAVALFRERGPDLVFMDLQMPVKDGFEATAEIRAMERAEGADGRRCRILALTADVLPETRSVCLAGGMDEYLAKPVRREEIRAVIERCLGPEKTPKHTSER